MNRQENKLIQKAEKGFIPNKRNEETALYLLNAGYLQRVGPDKKGRRLIFLDTKGEKYLEKLKKEKKEDRKFWIALWMNPISAIAGAIITYMLTK